MPQRRNEVTSQTRAEPMAFIGEYSGTNLIYGAWASPGSATTDAVWLACKMTYDGSNNLTRIQWASNANYSNQADNLSGLTYV